MKKSLVLGAAALATLMMAAPQQVKAGEVKLGGYYMFRMQDSDATVAKEAANTDTLRAWHHRVQLNMDMIQDKTTHAHMVVRALDSSVVQGADTQLGVTGGSSGVGFGSSTASSNDWSIRKAWLETEAWGVGLKVGHMPIALNDNILVNNDDTGFGAVMLSKTFGDVTAVLANVKINEGNVGASSSINYLTGATTIATGASAGSGTLGANDDDIDLYVLALLGKVGGVNYGVTGAYLDGNQDGALVAAAGTTGTNVSDGWLALTLNSVLGGVDVTGTVVYETGMNGVLAAATQLDNSGALGALRLKGDLPGMAKGSSWNAYGMYSSEDFTPITGRNPVWSKTWDLGGPGAQDLMRTWAAAAGATPESNIWAVGAGLTFVPAPNWTINPMLDYAKVVEDDVANDKVKDNVTSSAWGGGVEVATMLNPATRLAVTGLYVSPNDNGTATNAASGVATSDKMHVIEATLKMNF
ncbi:MAG: hypothetical protein HQM05_12825 [Magnetococcales bacterium]|nr:hypothetical protein [Magnetococcales bacterium]